MTGPPRREVLRRVERECGVAAGEAVEEGVVPPQLGSGFPRMGTVFESAAGGFMVLPSSPQMIRIPPVITLRIPSVTSSWTSAPVL